MQLDLSALDPQEVYKLLIGCVVPRPIAWVGTVDAQGVYNLAPFSFFNAVGANPPALCVSFTTTAQRDGRKDSLRNILETGEFTVNTVSEELAEPMNISALDFPPEIDEFVASGLTALPGQTVRAPRVGESPVSFECRLLTSVPVGSLPLSSTLVIGTVSLMHVRDDVINERRHISLERLRPIARLAGADYAYVHETFAMPRGRYNPETGQIEWPK